MNNDLFSKFAPMIQSMASNELEREILEPRQLLLESSTYRGKQMASRMRRSTTSTLTQES